MEKYRVLEVKESIFKNNDERAKKLREEMKERKVFLLNLMSSPGSGKTTTLSRTIQMLGNDLKIGVMEADIDSDVDAETIAKTGARVIQLHTGGMCHLDAEMTRQGVEALGTEELDLAVLENVGNLVCPAEFDTGAAKSAMILSVPEGDDKVVKYPLMFATTDALVLNKYDMRQYFEFDDAKVEADARGVNPNVNVFRVSSRTGDGLDELVEWISKKVNVILGKEKGGV